MRKRKHRIRILRTRELKLLRTTYFLYKSVVHKVYVTINHNISIYRRLNSRLLILVGVGLGLLHWSNMSNIYISNTKVKMSIF